MKRPRDSQRKRAYDAERQVRNECEALFPNKDRMTLPEIKEWVYKIDNSNWMAKHYFRATGYPNIIIKDGRGRRSAFGSRIVLGFPKWSRTKLIVLHELAHSIDSRMHQDFTAGHGREWARIFLTLVKRWSKEHYELLHIAFHLYKVKH